MSKETGGPAFPQDNDATGSAGMTLRDYFAAQALATIPGYSTQDLATWEYVDFAGHAYKVADAMLKARAA